MQAYLRWLRPDELQRFSLCVELAVDWFIAGNMDNCNKRGERFLKFQFGEIIEGFIGGKREITVAIWCHCKRWRNDPLGNGGDILQSDFIYCLQEMLQRLPEKITWHTSAINTRALIHPMRVLFGLESSVSFWCFCFPLPLIYFGFRWHLERITSLHMSISVSLYLPMQSSTTNKCKP